MPIMLPPPLFNILRFFLFHTILIKHFFLVLRVIKNVTYSRKNHLITWCVPRVLRLRFNHFAFHFFCSEYFAGTCPKHERKTVDGRKYQVNFPFHGLVAGILSVFLMRHWSLYYGDAYIFVFYFLQPRSDNPVNVSHISNGG